MASDDCGQNGVCAEAPRRSRHWAEEVRALRSDVDRLTRERDEARVERDAEAARADEWARQAAIMHGSATEEAAKLREEAAESDRLYLGAHSMVIDLGEHVEVLKRERDEAQAEAERLREGARALLEAVEPPSDAPPSVRSAARTLRTTLDSTGGDDGE